MEINHGDFTLRYSEIIPANGLNGGSLVVPGQTIGTVGDLQYSDTANMLHLEMCKGNLKGPLTERANMPFQRRSGLMNPTQLLLNLR